MEEIMEALRTIITIIQLIAALVLILVVTMQSGKNAGLGSAFGGNSDSFLSKNKAVTLDAKLARMTKWVAVGFVVLTLVLNILP